MTVLCKTPNSYKEGAYGVVFFDAQGYAYKVFKRRTNVSDDHVKAVFQSEIDALSIASQSKNLKTFVPDFFGPIKCENVFDAAGKDISHEFYLSFAYKMKKIDGEFLKTGLKDEALNAAFNAEGIFHTIDASVLYENGAIKCVVDIATQEHELWH